MAMSSASGRAAERRGRYYSPASATLLRDWLTERIVQPPGHRRPRIPAIPAAPKLSHITRRRAQPRAASARMPPAGRAGTRQRGRLRAAPDRPGVARCGQTGTTAPPDTRIVVAVHVVPSPTCGRADPALVG